MQKGKNKLKAAWLISLFKDPWVKGPGSKAPSSTDPEVYYPGWGYGDKAKVGYRQGPPLTTAGLLGCGIHNLPTIEA